MSPIMWGPEESGTGTCTTLRPSVVETIVTDPLTGGQKGSKLARFDLIPPEALWALAEHYGVGCQKYADRNWEKGLDNGLIVAALERHLTQRKMGEKVDAESGSHHMIAVVWHAIALYIYDIRHIGTDSITVKVPHDPLSGRD